MMMDKNSLWKLREKLPGHIAFNVALMVRKVRPVIQLDGDDVEYVNKIKKMIPDVEILYHSHGALLHLSLPPRTRRIIDRLRKSTPDSNVKKLIGDALELVCSTDDFSASRFRILLGVIDTNSNDSYVKMQMCTRATHINLVFREMERYEKVADEMGMIATTMKIVRTLPKFRTQAFM